MNNEEWAIKKKKIKKNHNKQNVFNCTKSLKNLNYSFPTTRLRKSVFLGELGPLQIKTFLTNINMTQGESKILEKKKEKKK